MDKLKRMIYSNKKIMVFLFFLFIISLVFGSVLPLFLSQNDKTLVGDYLKGFIDGISNYNFLSLFLNGLFSDVSLCLVIFILGISIIGSVVVIFLFFLKGFVLGFSVSSIIINYGFKGVLFAFIYVFPHQVINMFIYCFLTCYSVSFSIKFALFLFKKIDLNIRAGFKNYLRVLCLSVFITIICILYESFVLPKIFSFVINLLSL